MTNPRAKETTKDLRDARLAQALRHAPDAQALPSPALRDTIQTIAASAIATKNTDPLRLKTTWWHTLWASMGSARGPWGGTLATVVLGCIVTAMWYGQGVPDEQVRYSGAAPQAASADVAAPVSAPSAPTTAASAPPPPQERATTSPLTKSAAKVAPPAATIAAAPVQAPAPTAIPNRAQSSEVAAPQVEQRAAPAAREALANNAKQKTTVEAARARREADTSNQVAARPASGAAPVAPAPAANLAAAPSAPAAAGALLAPSSSADKASSALRLSKAAIATVATNWHGASVQYQGRSTQLAAADAQQLQGYVLAVVNSATPQALPGALPTTAPMLRIVFTETDANANPNGAQAMFTLWTGALQWQRTGQPDVVGVPQADALAQLLAQASILQK